MTKDKLKDLVSLPLFGQGQQTVEINYSAYPPPQFHRFVKRLVEIFGDRDVLKQATGRGDAAFSQRMSESDDPNKPEFNTEDFGKILARTGMWDQMINWCQYWKSATEKTEIEKKAELYDKLITVLAEELKK